MHRRLATTLSATAHGVLLGGLGGVAAGLLDHALGAAGARQFLPDGTGRLAVFLASLYGAAGALAGGVVGLVLFALARATDLGALWRSAFSDAAAREARAGGQPLAGAAGQPLAGAAGQPLAGAAGQPLAGAAGQPLAGAAGQPLAGAAGQPLAGAAGRPLVAYAIAAGAALGVHGVWVWQAALLALGRFHSPLLIAALVGAEAAAMALPLGLLVFALAALVGVAVPLGPRLRAGVLLPPGLLAAAGALGAGLGAALVAQLLFALQQKRRMTPALRALNCGLWAPGLIAGALLLAWLCARLVAPRLPGWLRSRAERPAVAVAVPAALAALAAIVLLGAAWPIAKLLPLRAVAVALTAPAVALALAVPARLRGAIARTPLLVRAGAVAFVPLVLLALALQAGRADRVRKAAAIHASLSGPLLDGIHAAWDFDRDGYSPLLGADCNDFDPTVHPGAFDWPDDGIDQNCNGHQATLARPPRPPFGAVPDAVPRRPNVVLVTVDALRWDHVGAYGYRRPTSPRIDELARESVLFENGWAHSPSTRYSVPAILIGRYESTIAWGSPQQHWPPRVLDENRLLSEMFKEQGYRTAALTSAHYFEPTWGLTQGFDEYDNSLSPLHGNIQGDPARATGSSSRQLADKGVEWVRRHAAKQQDRPFFLWIHFYDPHYVHERHPECAECSFGDGEVDLYDGEVRFTDQHVGRVLDALRASGAWDETIVILTADHGEGFGEHGVKLHGYHIYTAQDQVPFLVKVPGLPPRRVAEPVGHVDLFPTLLNLMRRPDEPQLLGRSFVDLLLGGSDPRLVFEEVDYEGPTERKAVASRTHQLIANVVPDASFEFYDLARDPLEAHDLFERGAGGEQGRLMAALGEWIDESAIPADFAQRVGGNVADRPLPFARPLGADLGGLLILDGVTAPPEAVAAGAKAEIDLVMHVPAPVPGGWRLFTHAVSSAGGFQNLDHEPVEGLVPLARLRPGQWVRDRIQVAVPAAWRGATVKIEVGMFRGTERAPVKLPAGPSGDQVTVATLRVAP